MRTKDTHGFRFRDWQVYKDSRQFRKDINHLVKKFPADERYALSDQTKRALTSIILNIAESTNKNSDKEMKVYINRSHCSLDEVVACLDCAYDDDYISEQDLETALTKAESLAKQLTAFTVYLSKDKKVNR
jgi:four helix bundle protein